MSPLRERFRKKIVPGRLEVLADQVDARLGLGQGFPSDFDNWLRRTFTGLPDDPWGNLYYLDTRSRRSYKVGSMGPDQKRGTEDDITVERPLRN